tara:strand:+ start:2615 stop:2917 length:303 start_codon:yes stop_codon:yes gene_type:complete
MGYYTRHELEIIEGGDHNIDYENEISLLADYGSCFEDEIKWYNRKEDMINYSEKRPNVLFKISGEGEEQPDMWEEYYKNGLSHRIVGVMTFEEFYIESLG